jgi:peptide deformylase
MTVRTCLKWPDKRLRRVAEPVTEIDDDIAQIWQDMIDTMESVPGVGLAAPQIGLNLRLAVVDASTERDQAIRMANPEVVRASQELREHEEASPNLPGVYAKIKRPSEVTVEFTGADGTVRTQNFVGLWAISVQHQIDHLNGKLYFHNLSKTKRDILLRRANKVKG